MKKAGFILFSAAIVLLNSCEKLDITGAGNIITQTRTIPAFTGVETYYDIPAIISYGTTQEVKATGFANLVNILETEVVNGVLNIKFDDSYDYITNNNVVVEITIPQITRAAIHGTNDIEVDGFTGNVIDAVIEGSGEIRISDSEFQTAKLHIYGSGDIDSQTLLAKNAEANIYGSGNIWVSVSENLKAKILGSGNVYYWGTPAVESEVQGSGKLIRK